MTRKPCFDAAIDIYFEAKAHLFRYAPEAKILDVGPLRCLHCHPGWPEVDGFYAVDIEPREAIAAIRAYQPHPNHRLTVMNSSFQGPRSPEILRSHYAELGYRSADGPRQPFMRKSPVVLEPDTKQFPVHRVETPLKMAFINSHSERMIPMHLDDQNFRYYYIELDGKPVCWGRTITTSNHAIYIAGMETFPEYRRRGLASALMNRMHADAVEEGAMQSVLCASPLGDPLYRTLGYEVLTGMQSFFSQTI